MATKVKTITAQNTFTTAMNIQGQFTISISGTYVATITLQRLLKDGVTWVDVDSWTSDTEENGISVVNMQYRLGVKTGDFTSGSVSVGIYT